ncbi:glycosyltransferase [Nonomuraea roseoviolacea]|uniref:Glycosyltransferase involved in cell wall biosynthesis/membrane-associated phospholipid phosphatase n=1 Tax=Nonomuraea roseoviolacea subsp. carminata TaxID=160689 RepID=A0ABT1KCW9_9ACTN|nr:glycosyltransferase [Nonomuraea roseoviolacea]MCP2351855.1 glycosyltransferase involved in cell wall biosynthesis/membrane-associated phospholipid phosphatase [Nonomuraea roseoviolacea subsp. carminata]
MRSGSTTTVPVPVSAASLGLGVVVGLAARTLAWTAADMRVSQSVQSLRGPWLTTVAQVLNVGFGTVVGTVLASLLIVGVAVSGRRRAAAGVLLVIAAGWGVGALVKVVVARPRPPAVHALVRELGHESFPSGHVCLTLSIVIAVALLARKTRLLWPVVTAGGVLVAAQMAARVYLGAHYPTDTLGSVILTPAAVHLAANARRLARRFGVFLLRADNRRRARTAGPPSTRQVKILLLHAYGMGGTIRTAFTLAGTLAAHHDVEIVSVTKTAGRPFFQVPPGVRVAFLDDRTGRRPSGALLARLLRSRLIPRQEAAYDRFDLRSDLALLRFLRGLRTGVLITTRPGLNLAAALLAAPGVITIGQEHTGLASHKLAVRDLIARRYGRLDALVTLTEADLAAYRAALGPRAPRHLLRIPNATPPLTGGRSPLGSQTVITIGRLAKVKGFDLLLRAWQRVSATRPGWRLRIVGSGAEHARLLKLAGELGLACSVELPGACRDVGAELDDASIFVLSSRREGFPMTILEALSKGMPVVAFDCPHGPGEIITHGHDGLLVPQGDVAALAAAIGLLIDDEMKRRMMGTAALTTSKRYDPEAIGERWTALLSELEASR